MIMQTVHILLQVSDTGSCDTSFYMMPKVFIWLYLFKSTYMDLEIIVLSINLLVMWSREDLCYFLIYKITDYR